MDGVGPLLRRAHWRLITAPDTREERHPCRLTTRVAPPTLEDDPDLRAREAASSSSSPSSSTCTASRTRSSCPPSHLDDLFERRRRLRGLRRRRRRPAAQRPGPRRDARRAQLHAAARGGRTSRASPATSSVEGEPWPYCPRTILRNQLDRAARARLRVQDRRRARVLPAAPPRGRHARARRPARHARAALLRHARADAQPRLRHRRRRATSTRSGGTTTRPTTRTRTASSSRTSSTPTR